MKHLLLITAAPILLASNTFAAGFGTAPAKAVPARQKTVVKKRTYKLILMDSVCGQQPGEATAASQPQQA